jgi:methionyl aminopeptidase
MEKQELEKYIKAGKIASEVCAGLKGMIKPGIKLVELAEFAEGQTIKLGGQPAFPLNISINEVAAHYTPQFNDERMIGEADLVKLDVGVHVGGYIGDTAFSWCSEKNELVEASRKVLEAGMAVVRPGVKVYEIGEAIQNMAGELGVGIIVNLTGHSLGKYVFHGAPSIPNTKNSISHEFKEGDAIAIEPFVLESNGTVKDSTPVEIYRHVVDKPIRLAEARKILETAKLKYHGLPFAKRWLCREMSPIKVSLALNQLESVGAVESFPVLKESRGKPVAQAEHTIIVMEKPIITTKIDDE